LLIKNLGDESILKRKRGFWHTPVTAVCLLVMSVQWMLPSPHILAKAATRDEGTNAVRTSPQAEVAASLTRYLGIRPDRSLGWPMNYVEGAFESGLISSEDKTEIEKSLDDPKKPDTTNFYLADRTFYGYKLSQGETSYTTNCTPPSPSPGPRVTGLTDYADPSWLEAIMNAPAASGNETIPLDFGGGAKVIVKHFNNLSDEIRASSDKNTIVIQLSSVVASIDAEPVSVAACQTVDVHFVVKDKLGNTLTGINLIGESNLGTYANGRFTAGKAIGTGMLTLSAGAVHTEVPLHVTVP
jgi:hypothetical protein